MHRRVAEESPHQHIDGLVQGGGEQHPLALRRGGLHQPPHHRQESKVGHVVGLVDHADFHVAQVAVPLLDEVSQPPRARDDDVHPVAERRNLRVLPDAAEDGRRRQVHRRGQRRDHGMHLAGQFPGGDQDEAAGVAGQSVPVRQARDHREREPECLARTGPPAAQDVQPGQRVGQGGGLDRERREDARPGQDVDQRGGHAEVGEGHAERGDPGEAGWCGLRGRRGRPRPAWAGLGRVGLGCVVLAWPEPGWPVPGWPVPDWPAAGLPRPRRRRRARD